MQNLDLGEEGRRGRVKNGGDYSIIADLIGQVGQADSLLCVGMTLLLIVTKGFCTCFRLIGQGGSVIYFIRFLLSNAIRWNTNVVFPTLVQQLLKKTNGC